MPRWRRRFRRYAVWRALEAAWNAVRVLFYARDVFVSYSHFQTKYAEQLADKLRKGKRGVASFIDQDASWSKPRTPRDLLWHARYSRVLAVVATPAAVQSPQVRTEVRLARRAIVIAPEEAAEVSTWTHPVWTKARGSTVEWQSADDIATGIVDDEIVARVNRIVGLMRASVRLALLATATLAIVLAGVVLVVWLSRRAEDEARRADDEAARADSQAARADREERRANKQEQRANAEEQRANAQEQRANTQEQRADAEERRANTQEARANAEEERANTQEQRANTEEQRANAEAIRAAQSQRAALASTLAGSALNLIGTPRHDEGLRLAATSYDTLPDGPSFVTRSALFSAVTRFPGLLRIFRSPETEESGARSFWPRYVQRIRRLPDGRFAVVTFDGTLRVVDLSRGESLELGKAGDFTFTVDVSPSGRRLVTAGIGGVQLWDVGQRKSVTIAPSSGTARFASEDRILSYEERKDSVEIVELDVSDPARPRAFDRMTIRAADIPQTCGSDACPRMPRVQEAASTRIDLLDVNPSAKLVAVGLNDGRVAVLDFPSGAVRHCSADDDQTLWLVRLAPDGSTVVRSSNDVFSVRNARSGALVHRDCGESASDAAFFGPHIAVATPGGIVTLLNGEWRRTLTYGDVMPAVDFGPEGKTIVAGSGHDAITVWGTTSAGVAEPEQSMIVRTIPTKRTDLFALSTDGNGVAVGSYEGFEQLVDIRTMRVAAELPTRSLHVRVPYAVEAGGEVHVRDAITGDVSWRVRVPPRRAVRDTQVSSDGESVAVVLMPMQQAALYEIAVWDRGGVAPRLSVPMASGDFEFTLSHDGEILAVGRADGVVTLHGRVQARFRAADEVNALAVSSDGATVAASIAGNLNIVLYDTAAGLVIGEIPRSTRRLAFTPDGEHVVLAATHSVALCDVSPRSWRELVRSIAGQLP